ncbi:MAG: PhnD/SsuA/transferrin family substrate-binding protein [Romboutsia sp.]
MKKIFVLLSVIVLSMALMVGCGSKTSKDENLVVYFVPSRDPKEIEKATEPLSKMLKDELAKQGFEFKNIDIKVGTSFEAVGEALTAGTAQVGFIPGGTYVLYDDGVDVALTATRNGLNHDSNNPADWNKEPTKMNENQVTYYRSLAIAGPSAKGQELAKKINNKEKLTKEDITSSTWGISSNTTSPAGYIYPSIWLQENYGISLTDLPKKVALDNYGSALAQLANGQIDVMVTYADARLDYADKWTTDFGRKSSIWDETNVVGVMDKIYNDTISVSKNSSIMTPELVKALQKSFIDIAKTPEGKEIISIYSHNGYEIGKKENYEGERKAQKLIQSMQK